MTTLAHAFDQLAQLAATANEHHALVVRHNDDALQAAIAAGRALLEAKAAVAEGGWLAWLKTNCTFSERTARDYMTVARDNTSAAPAAGPTLRKALKQIADKSAAPMDPDKPKDETNVVPLNTATRPLVKRAQEVAPSAARQALKGRARVRKREPNTPTPRQAAFVEAPKFFEDFLIGLEACTTIYGLPEIPPVLQTLMKQRIGPERIQEMIAYLQKVAETMGD